MPNIEPAGRGGARKRTRRRMMTVNEMQQSQEQPETEEIHQDNDKLEKLTRLQYSAKLNII